MGTRPRSLRQRRSRDKLPQLLLCPLSILFRLRLLDARLEDETQLARERILFGVVIGRHVSGLEK